MLSAMQNLARLGKPMTREEVALLSVAYRNVIERKRSSWHRLSLEEEDKKGALLRSLYRKKIEGEVRSICYDALELLSFRLSAKVSSSSTSESIVFLSKMKADHFRYLAEFTDDQERTFAATEADKMYNHAMMLATRSLSSYHLLRLSLHLNYSVFLSEIIGDRNAAKRVAWVAYNNIASSLEHGDSGTTSG